MAKPLIPDSSPGEEVPRPGTNRRKRVRVPSILQMEAVECGAAALAMIMARLGRYVPLEELRVECGVSRDGSKAANVLRAARRYGLDAKGYRRGLEKLYQTEMPCVMFWNLNHFVVLEGFSKNWVFINDPSTGPRKITYDELDCSFSGVVLSFSPGADFERSGQPPSTLRALRKRLRGSESALMFVLLCGLFLVIPGLMIPTFARVFIDEYLIGGHASLVRPLLIGMGLTAVLRMSLTLLQEHFLLRLETKLALTTSASFLMHVLRLPIAYFSQRFSGEIGARVMINDRVATMVSGKLATTLLDCVLVVFYGILMLLYDVPLTLAVVGLALINLLAVQLVSRPRVDVARRLLQERGKLTGTAMNGLRMIETIKATGSESDFFSRWAGYQAKTLRAEQELGYWTRIVSSVPPLVSSIITALILLVGGRKVMDGDLSVGMLVAYQTLATSFTRPLQTLVAFGSGLQETVADLSRLDDVLNHPLDRRFEGKSSGNRHSAEPLALVTDSTGTAHVAHQPAAHQGDRSTTEDLPTVKLEGKVQLANVTFGYSPLSAPLIADFNLEIDPGKRVALVGRSGSGKSTVARLIAGLYHPWQGTISFDGDQRHEIADDVLSNSIALVDQEITLFNCSVRDNVTLWDPSVPSQRVTRACRDAVVDEVIETRDGAYASMISEGGSNLSGGQRQRLEIARALVGDPTVLILDEATSALDPTTERLIDENLRRRGCTCILVAHRLSTIRDADEILVLERGSIIERGTHEAMKNAGGAYAELIRE